jgi:hypothetical protein
LCTFNVPLRAAEVFLENYAIKQRDYGPHIQQLFLLGRNFEQKHQTAGCLFGSFLSV